MKILLGISMPASGPKEPERQSVEERLDYLERAMEAPIRSKHDLREICKIYCCLKAKRLNARGELALQRAEALHQKYVMTASPAEGEEDEA